MQRIRTIQQAYNEIKEKDPDTAFSCHLLRQLVSSGAIPSIKAGTRFLINMEVVEKYVNEVTGGK